MGSASVLNRRMELALAEIRLYVHKRVIAQMSKVQMRRQKKWGWVQSPCHVRNGITVYMFVLKTQSKKTSSPVFNTPAQHEVETRHFVPSHTLRAKSPRTSPAVARSLKKPMRSVNSVSCGSLNQVITGTALFGLNKYDAGELSRIMQSSNGRPSMERSLT